MSLWKFGYFFFIIKALFWVRISFCKNNYIRKDFYPLYLACLVQIGKKENGRIFLMNLKLFRSKAPPWTCLFFTYSLSHECNRFSMFTLLSRMSCTDRKKYNLHIFIMHLELFRSKAPLWTRVSFTHSLSHGCNRFSMFTLCFSHVLLRS